MTERDPWLSLCREISGFPDVSARFANSAKQYFEKTKGQSEVDGILAAFSDGGADAVIASGGSNEAGAPAAFAKELLWYLYTGAGQGEQQSIPADYFESLLWRAALAHPPALSGGYFGHWRYPPEDAFDG